MNLYEFCFYNNSKSTKDKDVLAKDLHALLRGGENYRKLVVAHDTARIVQCLLKYSTADIREEISQVRRVVFLFLNLFI